MIAGKIITSMYIGLIALLIASSLSAQDQNLQIKTTSATEAKEVAKLEVQQNLELQTYLSYLKSEFVASSEHFELRGYIDARDQGRYPFGFSRNSHGFKLIPQPLDPRFGSLEVQFNRQTMMISSYHYSKGKLWRLSGPEDKFRIKNSVVSYQDLSFECLNWLNARWLDASEVEGREAKVIELTIDELNQRFSNYTKAKIYIDEKTQALVKIEYFDQTNFLLKRLVIIDVFKQDGYWFPQKIRVEAFDKRSLVLAKVNYIVFEQAQKALPPAFKD